MAHTYTIVQAVIGLVAFSVIGLRADDQPPLITDAKFEAGAGEMLRSEPFLLQEGGAKLIEYKGGHWFIAVGVTTVGESNSAEQLRMIRVSRINALRAAAEFINPTEVESFTILKETATVARSDKSKSANSTVILDDVTRSTVRAILRAPPMLGTWRSADGKLFFSALGAKLDK